MSYTRPGDGTKVTRVGGNMRICSGLQRPVAQTSERTLRLESSISFFTLVLTGLKSDWPYTSLQMHMGGKVTSVYQTWGLNPDCQGRR